MHVRKSRFRVKITCILIAQNESSGQRTIFYTDDISATGALIKPAFGSSSQFLINGNEYLMTIQLPAIDSSPHEIACLGKIIRKDLQSRESRYGVQFKFLNPGSKEIMETYMANLASEFPEAVKK